MKIKHELPPIYEKDSEILILGSIPSVKSREVGFYYGHPQNRFWKILAILFNEEFPITTDEKITFLKKHKIALWDVLASCTITKSSDASIKNIKTNGDVGGWNGVGGCIGDNIGTVEFCINQANVYPLGTTGYYGRSIGGIAGYSRGKIENCVNTGEIRGNHGTGGIIGEGSTAEINYCTNQGNIIGLSADTKYNSIYIGGIAGSIAYDTKCNMTNCNNSGEVKSSYGGSVCGGIVGYISGTKSGHAIIENCFNLGNLSGSTIAGIVAKEGYSSSVIGIRELRNNYYLDTCGATYGRPGNNNNAEPKTREEIDTLIKDFSSN